jgi:hypothetical protein
MMAQSQERKLLVPFWTGPRQVTGLWALIRHKILIPEQSGYPCGSQTFTETCRDW